MHPLVAVVQFIRSTTVYAWQAKVVTCSVTVLKRALYLVAVYVCEKIRIRTGVSAIVYKRNIELDH